MTNKGRADAVNMIVEQRRNEAKNFISDLNDDQVLTLAKMLQECNEPSALIFLQGIVQGNILFGRGMSWTGYSLSEEVSAFMELQNSRVKLDVPPLGGKVKGELSAEEKLELDHINAEKWGLEWNTDPKYPNEYRCKKCLTPVQSLQDRMLRDPGVEGCSTCQQKAKWGG